MVGVGVGKGFPRLVSLMIAGAVVTTAIAASAGPAEARRRHSAHRVAAGGGYNPPYAAIVVDGNTGRVLHAVAENEQRHPASVTKVMTLYLLFEAMEAGRLKLDTPLEVSAHASAQAPSKLGLRPGQTIEVEDAIKAIVTKSANDVAVVIAENIGGSEERFAQMMTRKARQLGMSRTLYRNASGLPDPEQWTTAKDLAILGRAIQERFPKEYRYFSTRSFNFAGRTIPSHNRLVGRVDGVDGIKTGYTRASGFNLLTSMHSDGRYLVGVVLGGRSAGWRDQRMASILEENYDRAYAGRQTNSVFAEASRSDDDEKPQVVARAEIRPEPKPEPKVEARAEPQRITPPAERAKPAVVAEIKPTDTGAARPQQTGTTAIRSASAPVTASVTPSSPLRWVVGPRSQEGSEARSTPPGALAYTGSIPQRVASNAPVPPAAPAALQPPKPESARPAAQAAIARTGWVIQLAAMDDATKARELLDTAKGKARGALAEAQPFTEKVVKDGSTLYRARFAGFDDNDEAQAACRAVKRAGFHCIAQKI